MHVAHKSGKHLGFQKYSLDSSCHIFNNPPGNKAILMLMEEVSRDFENQLNTGFTK